MSRLILLSALLLSLLLPVSGWAAYTYDANVVAGQGAVSATTCTPPSITIGSNANRIVFFRFHFTNATDSVASISGGGGSAWTLIARKTTATAAANGTEIWYSKNPTSGAQPITGTFTAALGATARCSLDSYASVDQTTPITNVISKSDADNAWPQLVITSAAGNAALATVGFSIDFSYNMQASTCAAAVDYKVNYITGFSMGAAHCDGAASTTLDWDHSATAAWSGVGFNLVGISAASARQGMLMGVYP